jgi:hypothetical protein
LHGRSLQRPSIKSIRVPLYRFRTGDGYVTRRFDRHARHRPPNERAAYRRPRSPAFPIGRLSTAVTS